MRRLGLLLLIVLMPLGLSACANRTLGENVSVAQVKLHEAERHFARAQSAIIGLSRAGVLKGETLAIAKKAEAAAYAAIQVARTAVDNKQASSLQLVSEALVKVLQLVATYAPGGK